MTTCQRPNCPNPTYAKGLCRRDYLVNQRNGFTCEAKDCTEPVDATELLCPLCLSDLHARMAALIHR